MTAAASHPELDNALREAGAAAKSEVREKVSEEIRSIHRRITQLLTAATFIGGLSVAASFFAVAAWLNAKNVADSISDIRADISTNAPALAANAAALAANAAALAANAAALAENRAAIQANSEKLDQLALNQEEIIRLIRAAKTG